MAPKKWGSFPEPLVIQPAAQPHTKTFILAHGRGSTAEKFGPALLDMQIGREDDPRTLQSEFPNAKFVFPTASLTRATLYKRSLTHQWFDKWKHFPPGHAEYNSREDLQSQGLSDTADFLHLLLWEAIAEVGAQNVVFGGLSQGCAASTIAFLLWDGPAIGTFVGMCGYLPFEDLLAAPREREDTKGDSSDREDMEGDSSDGEETEGDSSDGEETEGDSSEGENKEGDSSEGENKEGGSPDGEGKEGDVLDGEDTGEDIRDGNITGGNLFDKEDTEGDILDGENAGGNLFDEEDTEGDLFDREDTEEDLFDGEDRKNQPLDQLRELLDREETTTSNSFMRTPMFFGHGTLDDKVFVEEGRNAAARFKELGTAEVAWREYPELDHWYSPEMLQDICLFVKAHSQPTGSDIK